MGGYKDIFKKAKASELESDTSEALKKITIKVPVSLHQHFKIECTRQNTTFQQVLLDALLEKFGEPGEPD